LLSSDQTLPSKFLCESDHTFYYFWITGEIRFMQSGFPRGIESIEKVLNCEIGFQDLEKVLNLAKMYIKY